MYAANKSWQILAVLEDKFTDASFKADVPVESVALSYDQSGLGVAKVRERGALDVAGDIYANDKPIQQYQLTGNDGVSIQAKNDWNDYTQAGFYRGSNLKNSPGGITSAWFHVAVLKHSNDWIVQQATEYNGSTFFVRGKTNGKWDSWIKYVNDKHTNLVNTGWQPAGVEGSFYKRVGDVLTVKYNFTGTGGGMKMAELPATVFTAPQGYMFTISGWSIGTNTDTHVQINKDGSSIVALSPTKDTKYLGQLTIML